MRIPLREVSNRTGVSLEAIRADIGRGVLPARKNARGLWEVDERDYWLWWRSKPRKVRTVATLVGDFLRDMRKHYGLTTAEVAEATGIAYQTILAIENGRSLASTSYVAKVANAVGCDVHVVPRGGVRKPLIINGEMFG